RSDPAARSRTVPGPGGRGTARPRPSAPRQSARAAPRAGSLAASGRRVAPSPDHIGRGLPTILRRRSISKMGQKRRRPAGILATLALVACSTTAPTSPTAQSPAPVGTQPPPTVTAAPSPTADRNAGWRSDLQALIPGMAGIHPDLTHSTSREVLDRAVADLVATIPTATDDQLMVGVLRIVAMVSAKGCDAHTGAFVWGTGTYPVD